LHLTDPELEQLLDQAISSEEEEEEEEKGKEGRISRVIEKHSMGLDISQHVIIGRVIEKKNIVHFAKPHDSRFQYPFKADLLLDDSESVIRVVLWGQVCWRYYHQIELAQIIAITGIRLKAEYPLKTGPPYEVSVDSNKHPFIFVLKEEQAEHIPSLSLHLRSDFQHPPHPFPCPFDCLALVLFVGRIQRQAFYSEGAEPRKGFRSYRWIRIESWGDVGEKSKQEGLLVKLFANSQQSVIFDTLESGLMSYFSKT